MGKILLEGMEFFAYHGFYEEERKIGNKYSIDIEVLTDFFKSSTEDKLTNTINYETLYEIVGQVMSVPTKLLETVGRNIIIQMKARLGEDLQIKVKVSKFNPPIGGVCHKATIEISS